jgi:thymidylate synthase (FAD)
MRAEPEQMVLDHGYVRFIEAYGRGQGGQEWADEYEIGIVEAARQSTQGSFRSWEQDQKLLAHLHANKHATPFEFAGMVLEVQAPLFVFREWHRHRTMSYNEMSARYAPLPDLYYQPTAEEVGRRAFEAQNLRNRQQQGVAPPDLEAIRLWCEEGLQIDALLEDYYKRGLAIGVPKEVARVRMPVNHYSRMRVAADLRCWLAFMLLRADPNAQLEIRRYAWAVGLMLRRTFPVTWGLYVESGGPHAGDTML